MDLQFSYSFKFYELAIHQIANANRANSLIAETQRPLSRKLILYKPHDRSQLGYCTVTFWNIPKGDRVATREVQRAFPEQDECCQIAPALTSHPFQTPAFKHRLL